MCCTLSLSTEFFLALLASALHRAHPLFKIVELFFAGSRVAELHAHREFSARSEILDRVFTFYEGEKWGGLVGTAARGVVLAHFGGGGCGSRYLHLLVVPMGVCKSSTPCYAGSSPLQIA